VRLGGPEAEGELDLAGLFVGSEGCFGIAVEIEVALIPAPAVRTLLGIFASMEDAGRGRDRHHGRGLLPAALEIVDQETIRAVEASVFAAGFPTDAGAALVVEFDGVDAGMDDELAAAADECRAAGPGRSGLATSAAERDALWRGRKKAFGAMGRIAPDLLVQDATVPRSRLPEVLARIAEIGRRHDLGWPTSSTPATGTSTQPPLRSPGPGQLARVEAASREIMAACIEAGGTITGEHGVGIDKRRYLPLVCPPPVLRAMGEVRRAFDPAGRCNPGKVLPDGWGPPAPPLPPGAGQGPEGEAGARGDAPAAGAPRVLEYEPADLVIRMDARATLAELAQEAAKAGQWLPFDPPGGDALSLAQAISRGRSGPLSAGFGRIRDHVLGLTLLTGAGERLSLGGRVVKNVAGFDLVRLAVGSGDRLGRIEDVTLRLFPLPERDRTLLWEGPDAAGVLARGRALAATGAPVAALHAFGGSLPGSTPGESGFRLAVRLMGSAAAVGRMDERLRGAPGVSGAPASVLEGPGSAAWWEERAREAGGATPELSGTRTLGSGGRPESVLRLLEAFRPVLDGGGSPSEPAPSWISVHLLDGRVDLRLAPARIPPPDSSLRHPLEEAIGAAGGSLRVEGEDRPVPDPVRARLLRGVEAVFGPAHRSPGDPGLRRSGGEE
jgi:FAD/FMN-containing dehydrogenase